ncbi:hypothetical protein GCM10022297_15190 [Lactobacillus hamsteri]|uniref:Uncharacterized protein n=1 Tax=Lactobacillus hamsteri DSM 5661 = JCM 6256 TaxID=1423754 RepID=A0A0R1YCG9_9LACO|nr:hypothetical protein FC39_GL000881 [Lactobacillus hamsteri DSM 5661 = JCM 6256]
MDFLSKKHEYTFLNNHKSLVRVHVFKVRSTSFNIWSEGKSKKYRESIFLLNNALTNFQEINLPPIVVVSNKKLGQGGISSYDHIQDVIYFNNYYHSQKQINQIIYKGNFAAQNLSDIILHELAHKMHWDAVKRFYKANKSKYNNINEAKNQFDEKIRNYISNQNPLYLISTVTAYANESFQNAKVNDPLNTINEVIAEVITLKKTNDPILDKLITMEVNYGKTRTNGHS